MAYIDGKEVLFSADVNITEGGGAGLRTYSDAEIYNIGDIVSYNGLLYTPKADKISGVLPTVKTSWEDLTSGKVDNYKFDELKNRVSNLEGATLEYNEDNTSAYAKVVPVGVEKYALVNKVCGMTYKTDDGLRDTKVTGLVSKGANLIPFPYLDTTKTVEGITFTVNGDGTITANGTAATGVSFAIYKGDSLLSSGSYTFSGMTIDNGSTSTIFIALQELDENEAYLGGANLFNTTPRTISELGAKRTSIYVYITAGTTVSNVVFKPMLNRGTTAVPYKPYKGTIDTFSIPVAVQALEGYGRGVEGYPNYIDYERKVFVRNTYRKVFDGSEPWGAYGTIDDVKYRPLLLLASINAPMAAYRGSDYIGAIVSTYYETKTGNDIFTQKQGVTCADDFISYYDEAYNTTDISLWKAHLAELYANGKPLVIEYALATPIETNISAYLTDYDDYKFIETEQGGSIIFENEHKYDAPSVISYVAQLGGNS